MRTGTRRHPRAAQPPRPTTRLSPTSAALLETTA